MQQVRGGGVQGQNHKTQWQLYQTKLLGSIHDLLDKAFAKCSELYDEGKETEQLDMTVLELSNDPVRRIMQIYIRLNNLVSHLEIALR